MTPALLAALLLALLPQDQQVGARTKAMGGSYTAFEDDPVSVWLNPAGIATQPDGLALVYQSATVYDARQREGDAIPSFHAEGALPDPPLLPSYLGVTFQLGGAGFSQALGFCFTTPFRLKFGYREDAVLDPEDHSLILDQAFSRIRSAYACDFRLRPAGEGGFFTHVAVGAGIDITATSWLYTESEFLDDDPDPLVFVPGAVLTRTISSTDLGFGGGLGILAGLYDNTKDVKVNLGLAYQSKGSVAFSTTFEELPLADWPDQFQAGLTLYLFEDFPLRITFDAQVIRWDGATRNSVVTGIGNFEDAVNLSFGLEVRLRASETVRLYPRLGLRRYDPPWENEDELPAIHRAQLFIDTKDDRFVIFSAGLGIAWSTETARGRTFDIAFDAGGDAPGFAAGFSMEF